MTDVGKAVTAPETATDETTSAPPEHEEVSMSDVIIRHKHSHTGLETRLIQGPHVSPAA